MLTVEQPNVGLFATDRSAEVIEVGRSIARAHRDALHRLKSVPLPPPWRIRLRSWKRKIRRAWGVLHTPNHQLYPQCIAEGSRLFGNNNGSPGT
jgi:hypothetical protein